MRGEVERSRELEPEAQARRERAVEGVACSQSYR